jgi:STE24 endopeptidase
VDAVDLFGAEQVARASRYHRPLYAAAIGQLVLGLLLLALVVFAAPGGWLFEPVEGLPWWAQVVGFTALIEALTTAVGLPISFWTGFVRERSWGFSTQDLPGFAADRAKGFALGLVLAGAALLGLVGSARLLPRLWPLAAAAAGAAVVLALGFLAPLVIEPLFNRFVLLEDAELAAELQVLADRAQVPIKEALVADASRRTRKVNAYVSGLGRTRRLVLYDTLLERASRAEIGLVLAHELAHRRHRHLLKGALLGMVGLAGFVLFLWTLLRWPHLRTLIGAPGGARDPRVVPFVLLLAATLQIPGAPLGAALSRTWERQADRFSLDLTGDFATFEATHRSLATTNLSDLDPPRSIYLAFFSHPTPGERIQAAAAAARGRTATRRRRRS